MKYSDFYGIVSPNQLFSKYPSPYLSSEKDIFVYFKGSKGAIDRLIKYKPNQTATDSETVLWSYITLQENVIENLENEFVIVIHDYNKNTTILARDRFGIEPLYYSFEELPTLKFSQNLSFFQPKNLAINSNEVAAYLMSNVGENPYQSDTLFLGVSTILPAHYLKITTKGKKQIPYWNPHKSKTDKNTDILAEEYKHFFWTSVKRNIREIDIIGSHLSGGIDSSAVSLVAAYIKANPYTFYMDTQTEEFDEKNYARRVAKKIKSQHIELQPLDDIYQTIYHLSSFTYKPEQFILPSTFQLSIAQHAQKLGVTLMLTGHDGDSVAGHGLGYLSQLKKDKNWKMLNIQLQNVAQNYNLSYIDPLWFRMTSEEKKQLYTNHYWNRLLFQSLHKREFRAIREYYTLAKDYFGYIPFSFIQFLTDKIYNKLNFRHISRELLADDLRFSKTSDFSMSSLFETVEPEIIEQFKSVLNKNYIGVNEQLFQIGQQYGHRYGFPFFDKDLLETSFHVPESYKFGNGKTRALTRFAMAGFLPQKIIERGYKTDFSNFAMVSCLNLWQNNKDAFIENKHLWEFVSKKSFYQMMEMISNPRISLIDKSRNIRLLNRAMFLGIWLDTLK